jgi:hypothetical protein
MKRDHIDSFASVLNYLNNIDYINQGGCGISVLAMHRWLVKNKLSSFSFNFVCVYFKHSKDRYVTNQAYLESGKGGLIAPNHVLYYYNGQLFDSRGEQYTSGYEYNLYINTEENLIAMINNVSEWNSDFDRLEYVNRIESALNISLKEIKEKNIIDSTKEVLKSITAKINKVLSLF